MTSLTRFGKPRRTPRVSVERALAFERRLAEGKVYRNQNRAPLTTWYDVVARVRYAPIPQPPVESHGDSYRTTDPYRG